DDAVHPSSDVPVDDVDLLERVVFLERAVPDDLRGDPFFAEIGGRALGAAFDRLPEFVSQAFGNDGNAILGLGLARSAAAGQEQLTGKNKSEKRCCPKATSSSHNQFSVNARLHGFSCVVA